MKQITAYRCDFCKKVTVRKDRARQHESGCFKNPESKSCITCEFLSDRLWLTDQCRIATDNEMDIYAFKVEGTFHTESPKYNCDNEDVENYNVLNDEYEYLHNSTGERYCESFKEPLFPLRTRCERHKLKC